MVIFSLRADRELDADKRAINYSLPESSFSSVANISKTEMFEAQGVAKGCRLLSVGSNRFPVHQELKEVAAPMCSKTAAVAWTFPIRIVRPNRFMMFCFFVRLHLMRNRNGSWKH